MKNLQERLAARYHTTLRPNNALCLQGKCHVVGIDLDPVEMPEGRFIWFTIDHSHNEGGVLLGETFCSWSLTDPAKIRSRAIDCAAYRLGDRSRAKREVDAVIKAGGCLA